MKEFLKRLFLCLTCGGLLQRDSVILPDDDSAGDSGIILARAIENPTFPFLEVLQFLDNPTTALRALNRHFKHHFDRVHRHFISSVLSSDVRESLRPLDAPRVQIKLTRRFYPMLRGCSLEAVKAALPQAVENLQTRASSVWILMDEADAGAGAEVVIDSDAGVEVDAKVGVDSEANANANTNANTNTTQDHNTLKPASKRRHNLDSLLKLVRAQPPQVRRRDLIFFLDFLIYCHSDWARQQAFAEFVELLWEYRDDLLVTYKLIVVLKISTFSQLLQAEPLLQTGNLRETIDKLVKLHRKENTLQNIALARMQSFVIGANVEFDQSHFPDDRLYSD